MKPELAAISIVAVVLAGCAGSAAVSTTPPGDSSPAAASTPDPTALAPSVQIEPVAPPAALWGDWLADVDEIPGLAPADSRIQLSVSWEDGLSWWIQTDTGQVMFSTPVAGGLDEVGLASDDGSVGCAVGSEGRYRWSRSTDGLFLTLTAVEDDCSIRATTLARTWVRSLGAVNDGRRGLIQFGPDVEVTLPSEQFAMSGADGIPDIHSDAGYQLIAVQNPAGYRSPCALAAELSTFAIEPTVDDFERYLRGLPGFSVETAETKVDGHRAVHLVITGSSAIDCPAGEVFVFRPDNSAEDADFTVPAGAPLSLWAIEPPGDLFVFAYQGEGVTPAGEQAVISSIRFHDTLPAP